MSTPMLHFPLYYRRFGIRLPNQVMTPRVFDVNHLSIPRGSVLHYLPSSETELGPSSDELILRNVARLVFVTHVTALTSVKGNPRSSYVQPGPMMQEYRRRYRKMRPMNKLDIADREEQNLIVVNYALLPRLYRYIRSYFTQYYTWYNIRATMWDTVNRMLRDTKRQQFIQLSLPATIPTLNQLRRAENGQTKETLEPFRSYDGFDLLDLWCWLGKDRNKSVLSRIAKSDLERVNLVVHHLGKWMVINLGVLDGWRMDPDDPKSQGAEPATLQLRFLKMVTRLFEAATLNISESTGEEPAADVSEGGADEVEDLTDEEIKQQLDAVAQPIDQETEAELNELDDVEPEAKEEYDEDGNIIASEKNDLQLPAAVDIVHQSKRTHESAIQAKADQLADAGLITGAEYRRLQKISTAYKSLKDPYTGQGSLEEAMVIRDEDLVLEKTDTAADAPQVLDKSMLQSTVEDLDAKYVTKVLSKDILNSVMMVQQAGIAVTGYDVERQTDAVSDYEVHAVTLTPAVGRQSTIRFRVPKVRPNGTYMSNGVTYRMRKQRAD